VSATPAARRTSAPPAVTRARDGRLRSASAPTTGPAASETTARGSAVPATRPARSATEPPGSVQAAAAMASARTTGGRPAYRARRPAASPPPSTAQAATATSGRKMSSAVVKCAARISSSYWVTVSAPRTIWLGRTSVESAVAYRTRRERPPRQADRASPRIMKPAVIATRRWNHSTKLPQFAGNSPNTAPSQRGQRVSQVSPKPATAVYRPIRISRNVVIAVATARPRKRSSPSDPAMASPSAPEVTGDIPSVKVGGSRT